MGSESESPTRRVELSDGKWIELRRKRIVADVEHQRFRRHQRGDYDDDVLDELALVEARIESWSFGEKVPADMDLRKQIIGTLEEDEALKLIVANKGLENRPKGSPATSPDSSTGTRRSRRKAKTTTPSAGDEESARTDGGSQ